MTGPVFDMPAAPKAWGRVAPHLIRIVDPLGGAIAWFAPTYGAMCAGFFVRSDANASTFDAQWHEVITVSRIARATGDQWHSVNSSTQRQPAWRFVERDPVSCMMEWSGEQECASERWTLTASLKDSRLHLGLDLQTLGASQLSTGASLRLTLAQPDAPVVRAFSSSGLVVGSHEGIGDNDIEDHATGRVEVIATGADNVDTECFADAAICTIAAHRSNSTPPALQPNQVRSFAVEVGLRRTGPGRGTG